MAPQSLKEMLRNVYYSRSLKVIFTLTHSITFLTGQLVAHPRNSASKIMLQVSYLLPTLSYPCPKVCSSTNSRSWQLSN